MVRRPTAVLPPSRPQPLVFCQASAFHSWPRPPPLGGGGACRSSCSLHSWDSRGESPKNQFPTHMVARKRAPCALHGFCASAKEVETQWSPSPKKQTPICPMPTLTLRRCFPMTGPMASPTTRAATEASCPGPPSLPAQWTFFPFDSRAFAESCAELSQHFIFRNRKNLQCVRKDGCPGGGASVLAHIGLQQKKLLGNMAEALA